MSRIRGPQDKEYGQKNLDEAPKTLSQRAAERRAQNKIDAARRGQKLKDFFTKKNPNSTGAQLEKRKSLKAANKITMNIGKESKPTKKVGSRVRGPKDSIKTKQVKLVFGDAARVRGPKDSIKTKPAKPKTTAKTKSATDISRSVPGGDIMKVGSKKSKPTSFADAFRQAKGSKTFEFKGKRYARVTADEVKKAGFASLKDYLNAPGKKQIAKK